MNDNRPLQQVLEVSEEEMIGGIIDGLTQLGAVYKSHNKHNFYITVTKGSLMDEEHHQKKAKQWVQLQLGRVLKIVDE